jgi:PGAP1-like protein
MSRTSFSEPTRLALPLILIRGFGGLGVEDEKRIAYQGFNDGTVYPGKRGENYIYEGLILRFMKSHWEYQDATNVVGYYGEEVQQKPDIPEELKEFDPTFFSGSKVVIDPAMALHLLRETRGPRSTLWVFRYYDLNNREFETYGNALVRLIDFIRELGQQKDGVRYRVNIIAHSMGGLLVREAVQRTYPGLNRKADDYINKIVTLGTPHQGISFQVLKDWINIGAEEEFERFNPEFQSEDKNQESYKRFRDYFSLQRLLTVVGTNYRSYNVGPASWANRLFSVAGEFGTNYNRSDGLVKQSFAQIPGAPRTFVHKCHGGVDSLVTSREAFEIATRFFFGNLQTRLRMLEGEVTRGMDMFGKSEIFLGVSIKPRRVDFDLFHQSPEAENCYGPFSEADFSDSEVAFPWADGNKLIWEGYLDSSKVMPDKSTGKKDIVMRLDFYIGERDLFGVGFSDNVIFRKQYYVRAVLPTETNPELTLFLHTGEDFSNPAFSSPMARVASGWEFKVEGTGFKGKFRVELNRVPEVGWPEAI